MITSADNLKVRRARELLNRKGRRESGACLAEGVRLIEDAMRAGNTPALIFVSASCAETPRAAALLAELGKTDAPIYEVSAAVFATISDTNTSQGLAAVMDIPSFAGFRPDPLVLVLDQVRDPGNVGTILRSAEAAGAGGVLLSEGCADVWSPKVLRAGMGAHFRLPILGDLSWTEIGRRLEGRTIWLADMAGDHTYDQVDWTTPSAAIVGGESQGAGAEAASLAGGRVVIPIVGSSESLNAAMAATILVFEAARQQRAVKGGC